MVKTRKLKKIKRGGTTMNRLKKVGSIIGQGGIAVGRWAVGLNRVQICGSLGKGSYHENNIQIYTESRRSRKETSIMNKRQFYKSYELIKNTVNYHSNTYVENMSSYTLVNNTDSILELNKEIIKTLIISIYKFLIQQMYVYQAGDEFMKKYKTSLAALPENNCDYIPSIVFINNDATLYCSTNMYCETGVIQKYDYKRNTISFKLKSNNIDGLDLYIGSSVKNNYGKSTIKYILVQGISNKDDNKMIKSLTPVTNNMGSPQDNKVTNEELKLGT